jgi:crotonobetaine/carnitine-CoA ligase
LPALLAACAAARGQAPLVSDRKTTWTGSAALQHAAACAGRLAAAGVRKGDRVALLCGNRIEFVEVVLGCGWLGAVVVPINTASRGLQLHHILANSGARLLVAEASLLGALADIELSSLALQSAWILGDAPAGGPLRVDCMPYPPPGTAVEAAEVDPGDPLAILYTSGTSGVSKGVICPHAQFYWWGLHSVRNLGIVPGDVLYTVLPLFHTNALNSLFQALVAGACLVFDERFSASRLFPALCETGATVTYLLGAMVPILLAKPPSETERRHRVRIALGPGVPAQFHAAFAERTGIPLLDGFGSTETNFVIGRGIDDQRPGWMGRVVDGFEARVVDAHDEPVPDGSVGELVLRAGQPHAFASGYFGMPDKTVEAWRNLWFHTGDLVVRDADGQYKFMDRLKDSIRRRGENISSFEVEQAVASHPAVETVAVYAVRSELAEDEVMAAIVLRAGSILTPEEMIDWCEPRLPYFAVPRYLQFDNDLPKTENGKIQKYKLRERGATVATWDREAAGYRLRRARAPAR